MMRFAALAVALGVALFLWWPKMPDPALRVGVTTSVEGSGLGVHLSERWAYPTHRVVAGSGQMFAIAARGDVDVIITHDPAGEAALHKAGVIKAPTPIMQNRFWIVGPPNDPGMIAGERPVKALAAIALTQKPFISRGDDSGTHKAELTLWKAASITPQGAWYRPVGSGAGESLRMAAEQEAYALVDEASFARFGAGRGLVKLVPGPVNVYSVAVVKKALRQGPAQDFAKWLQGPDGQAAIAAFEIGGEQVFTPVVGR